MIKIILFLVCFIYALTAEASVDARSNGMGGVGVVSADYLMAPFYNPALAAMYRKGDTSGILLPALNFNLIQTNDLKNNLVEASNPDINPEDMDEILNDIDGSELSSNVSGGASFALPNKYLSMTIYIINDIDNYISPVVGRNILGDPIAERSSIITNSIKVKELGFSMAKYQNIFGQHFSFGVTPKYQSITTYAYESRVEYFDMDDIKENELSYNNFNMDMGFVWFYGPVRFGLSSKNLINKEYATKEIPKMIHDGVKYSSKYNMNTLHTIGIGILTNDHTISIDYDINEKENYIGLDDNEKMIKFGYESDMLFRTVKLRMGYKNNLAKDDESVMTFGSGFSLFRIVSSDISLNVKRKQSLGVSANFHITI